MSLYALYLCVYLVLDFIYLLLLFDIGDLVDVVVPPLAESIADGTLATFLKSMSTNIVYLFFF